jgi:hypothetical protein
MPREGLRLSRRHQAWLHGVAAALFVTGVLWLVFHHYVRVAGEFGDEPHTLEPWWLKLHGAAAMGFLVLFGTVLRGHIPIGWRARRNRTSGSGLVGLNVVLIATGWALYYVAGETARPIVSAIHWGLGLGLPFILLVHARKGLALRLAARRRRRRDVAVEKAVGDPPSAEAPALASVAGDRSE